MPKFHYEYAVKVDGIERFRTRNKLVAITVYHLIVESEFEKFDYCDYVDPYIKEIVDGMTVYDDVRYPKEKHEIITYKEKIMNE